MTAVAYIRRSARDESDVSESTQRETVTRLAQERGDALARVYRDWGQSGGSEKRPEYLAMLAEAEADGIHAIYAYDQDRLARSNFLFASLLRMADLKGFGIITPAGDLTSDDRRDFAEMRGLMDGAELRKIRRRNLATSRMQTARGDARGAVPFGYEARTPRVHGTERVEFVKVDPDGIQTVVDAYVATGSFLGAARALNAMDLRSKHGGVWHPKVVKSIVQREAPALLEDVTQGSRSRVPRRPRLFARLLRCHCGGLMSPTTASGYVYYYCGQGVRGRHAKPHRVAEKALLPWIRDEADHLAVQGDVLERPSPEYVDDSDDRQRLEAARDLIGEDAYREALERLQAAQDAHGERQAIVEAIPPRIDWEAWETSPDRAPWSTEAVNATLRAMWEYVELGPDLLPVRAERRVPEWWTT